MRQTALLVAFAAALAAATPALAKAIGAAEAKSVFFGMDMAGVYQPTGEPWRECVQPSGATRYWYEGQLLNGRLRISAEGHLCFSYESTGFTEEGCYTAERNGRGWKFVSVDDPGSVFLATSATKVNACPALDAPSV